MRTVKAPSPLTTKGDVHTHDGTRPARIPVGDDGQVLTADPSAPAGLAWSTVGEAVRTGGRWEVWVGGSPPQPLATPDDTDWVYVWVNGD